MLPSYRGTDFFVTKHGNMIVNKSDIALSSWAYSLVGKTVIKQLGMND